MHVLVRQVIGLLHSVHSVLWFTHQHIQLKDHIISIDLISVSVLLYYVQVMNFRAEPTKLREIISVHTTAKTHNLGKPSNSNSFQAIFNFLNSMPNVKCSYSESCLAKDALQLE